VRIVSSAGTRELAGALAAEAPRLRRLWLGTDHQGRDILALAVHGARTSILVAALGASAAVLLGTAVGLASVLGGPLARTSLRLAADAALGLPRLLLLLILAVALEGSTTGVAAAIGLASWMETARLVEAESSRLARGGFLAAAKAAGAGRRRLAVRHLLPNLLPVLGAVAPLVAAEAVLLESTLSYLGVSSGAVSWGLMVADGQRALPHGWWLVVFPGALVSLLALSLNDLARGMGPARAV
jgi:peptide/nickel transport system permease protein